MRRLSRYGWRAVDPARRPVLFVNPRSGGGRAAQAGLVERARERGIEALVLGPKHDLAALVDEAVADGADALGVAGGDGSLGVVAAAARAHGLPFVCVPAGTRNHFALDVGVDRDDLVGALDAFGDQGVERSIDVAEVNGRVFLDNVSLGIYGDAVQQPSTATRRCGHCWRDRGGARSESAASELRLVDDLGREHRHPAVVLVSNNPYALDRPVAPGTRPRLDGGELGIVVLDRPRPVWILRPGLECDAPRGGRDSTRARRRRRRGCRIGRAALVRDPAGRAARQDLLPSSWRLAVGTPAVTSGARRSRERSTSRI